MGVKKMEFLLGFIIFAWGCCYWVQFFMGIGTAYLYTKRGGDNGVVLCGWLLVFGCAATVPGLGIYLWDKAKKEMGKPKKADQIVQPAQPQVVYIAQPMPQQVATSTASATAQTPAVVPSATATVPGAGGVATSVPVGVATIPVSAGVMAASAAPVGAAAAPSVVSIAPDGSSVVKPVCPACGHILPSDSKFCEYCGTPLGVAAADASVAADADTDADEPEEQ